jgi:hypothetical protein
VIRLLVAVGILAAAYFFIVKPVLHTTDHAIDSANKTLESVDHTVQHQIHSAFDSAKKHGSPRRLVHCIQRAEGDVHKIRRCTLKF